MRDSFIFYRSFFEALASLPDDQKGRIFSAICGYALDKTVPEMSGIEECIFKLIKPQLDANSKKYENGKKGGRPKTYEGVEKPKENQNKTKPKPNVNVNVNVNDIKDNNKLLSKKGSRLENFMNLNFPDKPTVCPDEWGIWAMEDRAFTKNQVIDTWENFYDYWTDKTGKDAVKMRWQATWRTWVRRQEEFNK